MVRQEQGRKDEARKRLDEAREVMKKDPVGMIRNATAGDVRPPDWAGRLEGSLLRAEAGKLITGPPVQVPIK
jgi:hypothetical protein